MNDVSTHLFRRHSSVHAPSSQFKRDISAKTSILELAFNILCFPKSFSKKRDPEATESLLKQHVESNYPKML